MNERGSHSWYHRTSLGGVVGHPAVGLGSHFQGWTWLMQYVPDMKVSSSVREVIVPASQGETDELSCMQQQHWILQLYPAFCSSTLHSADGPQALDWGSHDWIGCYISSVVYL